MAPFLKMLLVIQAFLGCQKGLVTAIKMTISSKSDPITRDVQITCRVDGSHLEVQEMMVLSIGKGNGPPIATLSPKSGNPLVHARVQNVVANGFLAKDASNGFLRMMISNPATTDAGHYNCRFYFVNQMGLVQEMRKETEVFLIPQDLPGSLRALSDKVSHLVTQIKNNKMNSDSTDLAIANRVTNNEEIEVKLKAKISELETELSESKKSFSALLKTQVRSFESLLNNVKTLVSNIETQSNKKMALLNTRLTKQEKTFNDKIRILQNELGEQKEKLEKQIEKQNYSMVFFYAYNRKVALKKGDIMVFDRKLYREGQGYDEKTGIFTAEREGFYLFHVAVIAQKKWIDIAISVNGVSQSMLLAGDKNTLDHSTASSVVRLRPGDKVSAVVVNAPKTLPKDAIYNGRNSVWSGYLLKSI